MTYSIYHIDLHVRYTHFWGTSDVLCIFAVPIVHHDTACNIVFDRWRKCHSIVVSLVVRQITTQPIHINTHLFDISHMNVMLSFDLHECTYVNLTMYLIVYQASLTTLPHPFLLFCSQCKERHFTHQPKQRESMSMPWWRDMFMS